jgi:hypothetical protein
MHGQQNIKTCILILFQSLMEVIKNLQTVKILDVFYESSCDHLKQYSFVNKNTGYAIIIPKNAHAFYY